jgi:hypothetical protein
MKKTISSILLWFVLISKAFGAIIFEDNFDTITNGWTPSNGGSGHHVAGGTLQDPGIKEPINWTGWIIYGSGSSVTVNSTAGRNGTPCLKIVPSWPDAQSDQVGLVKYLGSTGYSEIYMRYYTKFDDAYRWGDGSISYLSFYKTIRMWQNVSNADVYGSSGKSIADETERGAIVFGYYWDQYTTYGVCWYMYALRNATQGTNGCTDCDMQYYYPYSLSNTQGYLNAHWGAFDSGGYMQANQTWHRVEVHVKLASTWGGTDGVSEVWIDGIKQDNYNRISKPGYTGPYRGSQDNIPTAQLGTGINYITLNDNQVGTHGWSSAHAVYYDDVVISTTPIGDYLQSGGCTSSPSVTISTQDNQTVYDASFTISGTASTTCSASVTSVTCPGLTVSGTTSWSTTATLSSGSSTITFTVTDSQNRTSTATIHVTYIPPGAFASQFLGGTLVGGFLE